MKWEAEHTEMVLGRASFARISAVEGIYLTQYAVDMFDDFDRRRLTPVQRRAEIIDHFKPALAPPRDAADEVDPYCYAQTTVLRNHLGLRDQRDLDAFEAVMTMQRGTEPLPGGLLGLDHYLAIHRHLFQDVFAWSGTIRTVRISKGSSMFCYPEHIEGEMGKLFAGSSRLDDAQPAIFVKKISHLLSELNAIHPFREGNGRTQLSYLALICQRAGHPVDFDRLDPKRMLTAMIASFQADETQLAAIILDLTKPQAD